ncbi:MAG: hypothetical protein NTV21_16850 [Planctomycetota bacterium]|nr:hypothetical protein [Planctomycetota bacterium]
MFKFLAPLAATFALVLGAAPAAAQGFCGPDNLDGGPCCLPTGVNLPSFPKIQGTDAKWIAFDNCGVALAKPYCVDLGKPKPLTAAGAIYCGQYDVRLQLRDCLTGVLHWSGGLRMSYSRNWQEMTTPGAIGTTVWRFLLNGDILPTAAVPMNPLDPMPGAIPVSDGPVQQGNFRYNNWAAGSNLCTFREPAPQGNVVANALYCLCATSTAAAGQFVDTFVAVAGQCGSSVFPTPASRFTQKTIGTWTNPNQFPGVEALLFDYGDLQYTNGCNGNVSVEWYEGVETIGGFPAIDFTGVLLGRQFEDWGSCNNSPTNPARRIGAPHVTYSLVTLNLP